MNINDELSPEVLKKLETVQKLLNLAAKNPNEAEAAAAASKANEMLTAMNLDVAAVEAMSGKKEGKREELKVDGGFYSFQRELWDAVAKLNFCLYWTQQYRTEDWRYVDAYGNKSMKPGEGKTRQKVDVIRNRHRLIGRVVNTRSTVAMAEYLAGAVERILTDRLASLGRDEMSRQSNWAMSFRKGAMDAVIEMVQDRREKFLAAEREKARKASRAATGASTATGLTISAYQDAETDANMDFIYGEGWSARQAQERAERAALRAKREAEYTAWAKANPEEAAARKKASDEALAKAASRSRWRGGSTPKDNTDYSAYYSGHDTAKKNISIDQQVDRNSSQTKRLK